MQKLLIISNFAKTFQIYKTNMPKDKVTNKISELQNNFIGSDEFRTSIIFQTLKSLKLSANFAEFNFLKKQGYVFNLVLSVLIWMTIQSMKTVNSSLSELSANGIKIKKDVYYRLKNSEKVCWRRILWYVVDKFLQQTQKNSENTLSNNEKPKSRCLILDDTLLQKTGNKIEKIGKVWDHVKQRAVLGFRLLAAVYFDGTSAIPVDFSIVREKGTKSDKPFGMLKKYLRRQFNKKRAKESESISRINELDISKIELSVQMFLRAVLRGVAIDYVLCDSWFTCSDLISVVRQKGSHLIGMYKIVTTKFDYLGKKQSYKQILHLAGKEKRCKKIIYRRVFRQFPLAIRFGLNGAE